MFINFFNFNFEMKFVWCLRKKPILNGVSFNMSVLFYQTSTGNVFLLSRASVFSGSKSVLITKINSILDTNLFSMGSYEAL